jgi:cysteine synthase A
MPSAFVVAEAEDGATVSAANATDETTMETRTRFVIARMSHALSNKEAIEITFGERRKRHEGFPSADFVLGFSRERTSAYAQSAMSLRQDILQCIGNTNLVPLRHVAPASGARILLKLENENPTGSMKDRMALAMIEAAEKDGRLKPGGSVVEYTAGTTGVSLSLVCAVKRYPLHIVSSDAFAREKLDHLRILGAELTLVPSDGGRMTAQLTRDMIETARGIQEKTGSFWTNQLHNPDQVGAYHPMADEIWTQTNGNVDCFVQACGSAASLRGNAEGLKRHNPSIRIVAVEPAESPVLSGGPSGSHKIDGIGAGFVVPLWRKEIVDRIEPVSTDDAKAMALRLAREEGLFAGTSTGANVTAALRLAAELPPTATIVTVMCDTGMKYLSTAAR